MHRIASRSIIPRILPSLRSSAPQRFLSTAPPSQKSRSWKSSAIRWGLAAGGIYYYNTSNVFAEEPVYSTAQSPSLTDDVSLPTLDSISASRRSAPPSSPSAATIPPPPNSTDAPLEVSPTTSPTDPPRTPEEYEEEAGQQGAFNEETGEINWDCPCLGGMAHGPCGEVFREAFSCFVFSKEEPKGMDCIDRFKGMQDCFRQHPETYGAELDDDDEDADQSADQPVDQPSHADAPLSSTPSSSPSSPSSPPEPSENLDLGAQTQRTKIATEQVSRDHPPQDESEALVPKAAHDATAGSTEK